MIVAVPAWVLLAATTIPVRLIGPSWFVTYLVTPALSVVAALVAVYVGHRLALNAQREQARKDARQAQRREVAEQNRLLDQALSEIDAVSARLTRPIGPGGPIDVDLDAVVANATRSDLRGLLEPLMRGWVAYDDARGRWVQGDERPDAEVASLARALASLKAATEERLRVGREALDRLEVP
jgi:hypothetical protein